VCLLCPGAGAAQSRAASLNAVRELGSPARRRPRVQVGRASRPPSGGRALGGVLAQVRRWFQPSLLLRLTSLDGPVEFESPHPAAASPPGSCQRGGGHRGRASPCSELEAVAARCGASSFSPPCHPRAISSGHQRYPAESHGQSEEAVGLGRPFPTWGGGGARNCMACKGSGGSNPLSSTTRKPQVSVTARPPLIPAEPALSCWGRIGAASPSALPAAGGKRRR
jgi:hypothetical protein